MTKRDYEIIAGILAQHRPTTMRDAIWARRWERIVVDLGKAFQERNPRFCLVKWNKRCNGGSNGRTTPN